MEPVFHSRHGRKKGNSAKTNLIISVVVHIIILGGAAYWAAHEGMLGEKMRDLSVSLIKGEKKEEKKPEKKPEEKVAKADIKEVIRKAAETAPAAAKVAPPPPPVNVDTGAVPPPPPPALDTGGFDMGAEITGSSDPVKNYKTYVEAQLRSKWQRPADMVADMADLNYVAEVQLHLDAYGKILSYDWLTGSGDERWDSSVKQVLGATPSLNRSPPKGFPETCLVRFDVIEEKEVPVGQ